MSNKYHNKQILYEGIAFKSTLEKRTYELLMAEGFKPEYEPTTFPLLKSFSLGEHIKMFKPRNKEKTLSLYKRSIMGTTYTPDFIFDYKGYKIIYDTKGKVNDTYPIKVKFFLNLLLNTSEMPVLFFEPHSLRQVKQSIDILKTLPYHK